jgi:hypothetical protein
MRTFQTTLAWLCAVLFVVSGPAALILFTVESRAFSAETYKQAFERQNLYTRMPAILADAVYTSVAQDGDTDPFLRTLTVSDWQAGIASLLPPEELKALSNETLDSVFGYLNNQSDSASISLRILKTRLAGPQGMELVSLILNAQPDCTLEQLLQMGMGFVSGDVSLCKPPDEMMGLVTPVIEAELRFLTGAIPDEVTLIPAGTANPGGDTRLRLNRARTIMKFSPLLPIVLLIALTALAVRNLTDWFQWWGYPFLVIGAISALAALIGSPVLGLAIQTVMQSQAGFLPPVLISALGETVSAVSRQILSPVVLEGALLAGVGLVLVVAAVLMRRR